MLTLRPPRLCEKHFDEVPPVHPSCVKNRCKLTMVNRRARILLLAAALTASVAGAQEDASTEGKSPFAPVPPAASDSLRFNARLPEFEAQDINGRTWRSSDLRGKLTVIYIWHTFDARRTDSASPRARQSIHGLPELPGRLLFEVERAAGI